MKDKCEKNVKLIGMLTMRFYLLWENSRLKCFMFSSSSNFLSSLPNIVCLLSLSPLALLNALSPNWKWQSCCGDCVFWLMAYDYWFIYLLLIDLLLGGCFSGCLPLVWECFLPKQLVLQFSNQILLPKYLIFRYVGVLGMRSDGSLSAMCAPQHTPLQTHLFFIWQCFILSPLCLYLAFFNSSCYHQHLKVSTVCVLVKLLITPTIFTKNEVHFTSSKVLKCT